MTRPTYCTTRLRPEIFGAEALYNNVAELSLAVLAAFAAARDRKGEEQGVERGKVEALAEVGAGGQ